MEQQPSLLEWYLARLRRLASEQREFSKLTPMALVESDKSLIQNLVSRASSSQSARADAFLDEIRAANSGIKTSYRVMLCLGMIVSGGLLINLIV